VYLLLSVPTSQCTYCWVYLLLSVPTAECTYCSVYLLFSVTTAECTYCWVYLLLSVPTAKRTYCWVYLLLSVPTAECTYCSVYLLLSVPTAQCIYFSSWEKSRNYCYPVLYSVADKWINDDRVSTDWYTYSYLCLTEIRICVSFGEYSILIYSFIGQLALFGYPDWGFSVLFPQL
jgi:hypothetical protein